MVCPYCSSKTQVTNTRARAKNTQVWRRRVCLKCHQIWTTTEILDLSTTHRVVGIKNHLEPFSRDKLFISIKDACSHRKSALADATAITDTVLARILLLNKAEITKIEIADIAKPIISRFDKIAGAVYAAVANNN